MSEEMTVQRADIRGGLTIEMPDTLPVNLQVASNVYIKQADDLIYLTREAAVTMAWSILASLPALATASKEGGDTEIARLGGDGV